MGLVQRYSLEPFITQRRFFYSRVVIDFYQSMTSQGEHNPIAIRFTIDSHKGILWVADIAAAFHLLVILTNSADYRQWPHPSPWEMVWILSRDTSAGPILPYFVPETASNKDAFHGPYTTVQSISSSTSFSEVGRHPGGPILHFGGLLV